MTIKPENHKTTKTKKSGGGFATAALLKFLPIDLWSFDWLFLFKHLFLIISTADFYPSMAPTMIAMGVPRGGGLSCCAQSQQSCLCPVGFHP